MKKITFLLALCSLLIVNCATTPKGADELDIAIRDTSDYLNDNILKGSKIVILNIQSDYAALSEYIIDELIANAVNDKVFSVVDRAQVETSRMELNFQVSGEVDDDSALSIGKFLGAQTIVSGAISEIADRYRMRIRALNVQTAEVQGQYNRNINASKTIAALMKGGKTTNANYAGRSGTVNSGTTASNAQTTQTTQAQPAKPKDGTYTFYPRLRAYSGAAEAQAYISHIVVRGDYMNIYITGSPQGSYQHPGHSLISIAANARNVILQDLDNPAKSYNPIGQNNGWEWDNDHRWYPFRGVTAKRFKLTFNYDNPPIVWEEITLGEPDD
jgi:hypothetical protein